MQLLVILLSIPLCYSSTYDDKRAKLLKDEEAITLGGNITLTEKENKLNECLMRHKYNEIDYAFNNPEFNNFSYHYFKYRANIHESKVYRIIKDIPKGAVLHVHDMGILGPDYLMNITYMNNLYFCSDQDTVRFIFSDHKPNGTCDWKLLSEVRRSAKNVTEFDANIRRHFTLVVDDPTSTYPCIKDTWSAFMEYFTTVLPLISYRPIWQQYFYDVLKEIRQHNVMYIEVRSILPQLYELDGTTFHPIITAKAYNKAINRFVKDYPDFFGAKLIYAPPRHVNSDTLATYLQLARRLKTEVPDIFAGFDLVGQEDLGNPLISFVPQLAAAAHEFNYFFHAGETDWSGSETDENLVDAILLGAKRLGHAYALPKHPLLMKEVLKNDIGLEVNVISNAVLSLVQDVRNHPLATFLAHGLPVVLSSDDPGAWETDPLSQDFYVAFVGVASRHSDLRLIKQLAINSLRYSALDKYAKNAALDKFNSKWNEFVDGFDCSCY